MRVYFIAMSIRIACVASLFFVRGWWILLVGLAAVILPYFAVIFANERATADGAHPDRPTPGELTGAAAEGSKQSETELLVVDVLAERRTRHHGEPERSSEDGRYQLRSSARSESATDETASGLEEGRGDA